MSIRLRTLVKKSVADVTPQLLSDAIASRLEAMTKRCQPADAEPARAVLVRMRIEREDNHPFGVWRLHWADDSRYVRIERWVGGTLNQERRDLVDELKERTEPETQRVRDLLHVAKECVVFELSASDASAMAWPVAMSAAAALALAGDGMIRVDGEGWLEPKGKEVATVLTE